MTTQFELCKIETKLLSLSAQLDYIDERMEYAADKAEQFEYSEGDYWDNLYYELQKKRTKLEAEYQKVSRLHYALMF